MVELIVAKALGRDLCAAMIKCLVTVFFSKVCLFPKRCLKGRCDSNVKGQLCYAFMGRRCSDRASMFASTAPLLCSTFALLHRSALV